jgi:hypothetical protein
VVFPVRDGTPKNPILITDHPSSFLKFGIPKITVGMLEEKNRGHGVILLTPKFVGNIATFLFVVSIYAQLSLHACAHKDFL